MMANDIR